MIWSALVVSALTIATAEPTTVSGIPSYLHGRYRGVSDRAEQGYLLERSSVDFVLDARSLTMTEWTDSGLLWKVRYPLSWLINELEDSDRPCLGLRSRENSTTPRLSLCFPPRYSIKARRIELRTFGAQPKSIATFVKDGKLFAPNQLLAIYGERRSLREFGPPFDRRWREIDVGFARDVMMKDSVEDKVRLIESASLGLPLQHDAEQVLRKYVLAMGLNSSDLRVQLAVLMNVGRYSPIRSALEFIRERLHPGARPEFALAAIDLAGILSVQAKAYREPFVALWNAHATSDLAEVHARTGGVVGPEVIAAIRAVEHPRPEVERWSEDDQSLLVGLLTSYANDPQAPVELRHRASHLAIDAAWPIHREAPTCGEDLTSLNAE